MMLSRIESDIFRFIRVSISFLLMCILFCLCLYHAILGSSGVCAVGYFKCTNDLCIPNKLLCNGVDNCYDGPTRNDEDPQGECQGEIEGGKWQI